MGGAATCLCTRSTSFSPPTTFFGDARGCGRAEENARIVSLDIFFFIVELVNLITPCVTSIPCSTNLLRHQSCFATLLLPTEKFTQRTYILCFFIFFAPYHILIGCEINKKNFSLGNNLLTNLCSCVTEATAGSDEIFSSSSTIPQKASGMREGGRE